MFEELSVEKKLTEPIPVKKDPQPDLWMKHLTVLESMYNKKR